MNFEQEGPVQGIRVTDPHSTPNVNQDHPDLEDRPRTQEDISDVSQMSTTAKVMHCFTIMTKPIYCLCNITGKCLFWMKNFIYNNKITSFVVLQMLFIFLRLSRLIGERTLFWLTFIPIFLILLLVILHLCITAQRNSREIQLQRQQTLNARARRLQSLDQFHDRLMEQILLNSVPNRLDLLISGNGGRMRIMHLEPDLDNLNGTRMQIRMISRGLLRLLGEFIEEQQLAQSRAQRSGLTEEQINSLPIVKYLIPLNGVHEEETCSICIDEFKQEQDLRKLPCNHKFHLNCVDEWLKISNTCPNCKTEVVIPQSDAPEQP